MPFPKPHRILVPTDFSEHSDKAFKTAILYAGLFGSSIDLVHVHPSFENIEWYGVTLGRPEVPVQLEASVQKLLHERATSAKEKGILCEVASLEGSAAREILSYAELHHADLIVMGTQGRTGVKRALLGSVAARVIQKAGCPVLVVPPVGDRLPEGVKSR